ncbi:tryptophan synthase subunit beta [Mycobacteroides abscessus subsp. abscessus]|nr:tryptophan synthase subunit beta [Mycobacteroides abscessus subsp. abscessus]
MVRYFHDAIGTEARAQVREATGALPDAVAACVGGGSNAIGIFHAFLDDPVDLYGFEAGGDGVETGRHAATITLGRPGMLHGAMTYLMQDEDGQTIESHSISAGLDYPGVGPEHAHLADIGRVSYQPVTDTEAMDALRLLCCTEGIIPAVESAHALAGALRVIEQWKAEDPEAAREKVMVVCLSGRGDKDMDTAVRWFGLGPTRPQPAAPRPHRKGQSRPHPAGSGCPPSSRRPPSTPGWPSAWRPAASRAAPPSSGTCPWATPARRSPSPRPSSWADPGRTSSNSACRTRTPSWTGP